MKNWGIALIIAGALIATIALFIMSSTVSTENMRSLSDYGGMIGTGTYSEIHNLPRAQLRELVFQGGCVLFLAGVLFAAVGQIEERLAAIGFIGSGDARALAPQSAPIVPFETAMAEPETPQAAYIPPDPDELAREAARNKLLVSSIFIPFAILAVIGILVVMRGGG
ncbi:MAG: hypothetical protein CMO29_02085 [Tistrella sp.]|nr:hypothetical protein [Tistrella sp.]|tara:strand:+ start:5113 stop:5613 length:501 start_codon:yes stop_codon:yes gene_type:complete